MSDAPLSLAVDVSDSAIGSVFQHVVKGVTQPLAFFSCQLKPAERCYSTFDRELLAIFLSVRDFQHQLEGRHFRIYTDHKPLTFALSSKTDKHSLSADGVMVIVVGNGHGDTSSNPGRG